MKKLSIIIPAYNEEETLLEILSRVIAAPLEGLCKEIIIIDDCSTDNTGKIIEDLKKDRKKIFLGKTTSSNDQKYSEPEFVFLKNDNNSGKGYSIRKGIEKSTGDIILIQDADLEYNPFEYKKLLQPITDGRADVVYGSRFLGETRRVLYFWHTVGNTFLTLFSNIFTDLNMSDMETCYKAFKSNIIKKIKLKSNRFGFEPEVTAKLAKIKARIYEVPISYSGRTYEQGKKITWKDGFHAIYAIFKYNVFPGDFIHKSETESV
ncbi:MAG: glycosyltransferase family 2 protein [Candidatus Aureabacteria bacterium]|nr:glycosyltransferase family 2 protein [Candidatus Auribacterota bacterium]